MHNISDCITILDKLDGKQQDLSVFPIVFKQYSGKQKADLTTLQKKKGF